LAERTGVPAAGTPDTLRTFAITGVNHAIMGVFLSQIVTYPSLRRMGSRVA